MKRILICIAVAIAMNGCGDKAKSIAYYREHIDEARSTSIQCQKKNEAEVSAMSPSRQAAWNESAEGINCRNVDQVLGEKKWNDYQKRLEDNAHRFLEKNGKR
jgi:hypothetical protein